MACVVQNLGRKCRGNNKAARGKRTALSIIFTPVLFVARFAWRRLFAQRCGDGRGQTRVVADKGDVRCQRPTFGQFKDTLQQERA